MRAWAALSRMQEDEVWNRFQTGFDFRPSVDAKDWPGIREPRPFRTWSVPYPWPDAERADLHACALAAFRQALPEGGWLAALDWQHACYRLRPHVPLEDWGVAPQQARLLSPGAAVTDESRWRIPVLPDGDYSIFLAPDFDWGWFAHPWEQSICVFGEPMLTALGSKPVMFRTLLREG